MAHVFISHVSNNERKVQKLRDELTRHGAKVWLAQDKLKGGSRWQEDIEEAIQEGDFFLACFSEQYNRRIETFMNEELVQAIEKLRRLPRNRTWFIPVKLNKCEIPNLRIGAAETLRESIQWIDLQSRNWDAGIQRILDVIQPIPPNVQSLIYALRSDDYVVRRAAAEALEQIAHNAAVPALIEALKDKYPVCRLAASALGKIGEPAVPALIEALKDEEASVRQDAASALGKIGDPRAVPALIEALKYGDTFVRFPAASALGKIGDPRAVPALIEALKDKNYSVRGCAAFALEEIGTPEALKAIEEYDKQKKEA